MYIIMQWCDCLMSRKPGGWQITIGLDYKD